MNHPHVECLTQLARILTTKIPIAILEKDFENKILIPDALAGHINPVYTEIAEELGYEGSYIWENRAQNTFMHLEQYLEFAFKEMEDTPLLSDGFVFLHHGHSEKLDEVLTPQI